MSVLLHDIKKLETEAVLVGFYEDVRPLKGTAGALDWLLCGSLSGLIINHKLRGSLGDVALLTSRGKIPAPKIFMVGLGPSAEVSPKTLHTAARAGAASAAGAGVTKAALDYFTLPRVQNTEYVDALRDGLREGAAGRPLDIALLAPDAASFERLSKLVRA